MRRVSTDAERRLWWHLRYRLPAPGTHFRRQVPLGPYFADFCCLAAKLIIEVDGNHHGLYQQAAHDKVRAAYLEAQGFRVIRFGNREVMTGIDIVLDTILAALERSASTPDSSPHDRGSA